jgi:hypothetical protein
MDAQRRAARWNTRRIIYNNDGDDVREPQNHRELTWHLLNRSGGELSEDFLSARSRPLLGTQVDSLWYSTCFNGLTFSHHTRIGDFYGTGVSQELVDVYGRDNLQIQTDFCHANSLEGFWSLRMNDAHDATPEGIRTSWREVAPFKRDHPHFMLGQPGDWEKYPSGPKHGWTALDFSFPEVRDHVFSLIEEVCMGYDVDGIELDFLRAPVFFRPTLEGDPVEAQHVDMMTDLVRRIRSAADEAGQRRERPLLVAMRTPMTVEKALFIGLDLERWLAEDLIDLLIAGDDPNSAMIESFEGIVNLGHKHDVPVYPCIPWLFWHYWAYLDLGAHEYRERNDWVETLYYGNPKDVDKPCYMDVWNGWEGTEASLRGAAANLWNAGADGIYVFNGFCSGGNTVAAWQELGDPASFANKDKVYGVDRFATDSGAEAVRVLELKRSQALTAQFQVGEDLTSEGSSPRLRFRLHLWDAAANDDLCVKLNGAPLEGLQAADPAASTGSQWLECGVDAGRVNRGANSVELVLRQRDESMQQLFLVDAVQLHVHYE